MRNRARPAPPGLGGIARVGSDAQSLVARLRPGDVAVIDQADLNLAGAQALVQTGITAVVNASSMISPGYANLGPELLGEAGVAIVDGIGSDGLAAIEDSAPVRLHEGTVYLHDEAVATGREVDPGLVRRDMDEVRARLVTQLAGFTRSSTDFLWREQDALLHGRGVPVLSTPLSGRCVVVVVGRDDYEAELAGLAAFLRDESPVVIAVDEVADDLRQLGLRADVAVVSELARLPSAKALSAVDDVVVRVPPDGDQAVIESIERLGVTPLAFASTAAVQDVALLLAAHAGADLVVEVGAHLALEDLLNPERPDLSSAYLTRLKLGPRLVDARAVPRLYSGRVRPRDLALVVLAGLVALLVAVSVTPVGSSWLDQVASVVAALAKHLQGLFV